MFCVLRLGERNMQCKTGNAKCETGGAAWALDWGMAKSGGGVGGEGGGERFVLQVCEDEGDGEAGRGEGAREGAAVVGEGVDGPEE